MKRYVSTDGIVHIAGDQTVNPYMRCKHYPDTGEQPLPFHTLVPTDKIPTCLRCIGMTRYWRDRRVVVEEYE